MLDRISESTQNFAVFTFAEAQENGNFALKNSKNETVVSNEVTNKFTYLIVSSPSLSEGDYSLFNGETKLQGAKANNDFSGTKQPPESMTRPDGEMPQMPDCITPPEKHEGGQRPEKPEGEIPEGMMPPEGEIPDGMTPPEGDMRPGNRPQQNGITEVSDVFKITTGGNYFVSVK